MAVVSRRLYELFETKWVMQRQNPGGTSPYLQGYLLGHAGTINIENVLHPTTKVGAIKLRVGNGPVQERPVDFSTVTPGALTPSMSVTALLGAGFSDCEFEIDSDTGRLKLKPLDPTVKFTQVYGDLAAALNFGNCRFGEGKGCYLWASFDGDLKSIAETEEWTESKKITNESLLGSPVNYTTAGKRSGTGLTISDRQSSYAARQMVVGGRWIGGTVSTPEIYEPPTVDDDGQHRVDVFTFSDIFDKMENNEGSQFFVRERMYIGCIGKATRTGGAGSWSDTEYALTAASYTGEDGAEHASPRETNYPQAQWESMQLKNCLVRDWEGA